MWKSVSQLILTRHASWLTVFFWSGHLLYHFLSYIHGATFMGLSPIFYCGFSFLNSSIWPYSTLLLFYTSGVILKVLVCPTRCSHLSLFLFLCGLTASCSFLIFLLNIYFSHSVSWVTCYSFKYSSTSTHSFIISIVITQLQHRIDLHMFEFLTRSPSSRSTFLHYLPFIGGMRWNTQKSRGGMDLVVLPGK